MIFNLCVLWRQIYVYLLVSCDINSHPLHPMAVNGDTSRHVTILMDGDWIENGVLDFLVFCFAWLWYARRRWDMRMGKCSVTALSSYPFLFTVHVPAGTNCYGR